MVQLLGHAIIYRLAVESQARFKLNTLQTPPACEPGVFIDTAVRLSVFSRCAGATAEHSHTQIIWVYLAPNQHIFTLDRFQAKALRV